MRKLVLIGLMVALFVSGCAKKTEFGECIGIQDDKNPALDYKISVRNIVVGSIFMGTIFVPAIVLFSQVQCPVGKKN